MADLKKAFESLGFKHVQTYLQSGNVIFYCEPMETANIAERVEEQLREFSQASSKAIIRTRQELGKIVENNPLARRANGDHDKLHVTFLFGTPDETVASKLDLTPGPGEMFAIVGKEVHLYCPNGNARTS